MTCPVCEKPLTLNAKICDKSKFCFSKDHCYLKTSEKLWTLQVGKSTIFPSKEGIKIYKCYYDLYGASDESIILKNQFTVDSSIFDIIKNLGVL